MNYSVFNVVNFKIYPWQSPCFCAVQQKCFFVFQHCNFCTFSCSNRHGKSLKIEKLLRRAFYAVVLLAFEPVTHGNQLCLSSWTMDCHAKRKGLYILSEVIFAWTFDLASGTFTTCVNSLLNKIRKDSLSDGHQLIAFSMLPRKTSRLMCH